MRSAPGLSKKAAAHRARLQACQAMAADCAQESEHAHQVTRLALALFDELKGLHGLGDKHRRRLEYAALLHDIGWKEGGKGHHKASLKLILEASGPGFARRKRRIVACVARYHRGPLPARHHRIYGKLAARDQRLVRVLAAILRVADGLDRSHRNLVTGWRAVVVPGRVTLTCTTRASAQAERQAALKKGDLFAKVFRRELAVECTPWQGADPDPEIETALEPTRKLQGQAGDKLI